MSRPHWWRRSETAPTVEVTSLILRATCSLLGPRGVRQQIESAEQILRANALPIHVLLLQQEGTDFATAILTLAVPLPTA